MNWYRTIYFLVPILVAMTGCVVIPEQPQIVSQTPGGKIHITAGACDMDTTQAVKLVKLEQQNNIQALDPNGFSVLNWNIYKGNREKWKDDFSNFAMEQDIVLLQEALLNDELKTILKNRGLSWHLNTAFYYDDFETGVLTASRISSGYHCALRATEPVIRTPKTAMISRYPLAGMSQQLLVANIHGINFTLGMKSYRMQMTAVEEILADHDGPIVLAGDFNNWSDERTRVLLDIMQRLSLKQLPYRNHNRTLVLGSAIDHVFYRGLEVIHNVTHHVTSSDHNPITVTFKYTDARLARILE